MSVQVEYQHRFDYRYDVWGQDLQPLLPLDLVHPRTLQRVTLDGYLDSGCSRSLFDGRLALAIGLDPTSGRSIPYTSATGVSIRASLLPIQLEIPQLGRFQLEVGFTQVNLDRNLLGRDFLARVQLGLRENRSEFYLSGNP